MNEQAPELEDQVKLNVVFSFSATVDRSSLIEELRGDSAQQLNEDFAPTIVEQVVLALQASDMTEVLQNVSLQVLGWDQGTADPNG